MALSRDLQGVFAIHPRTRRRLEDFGLMGAITGTPAIQRPITLTEGSNRLLKPQGLVAAAREALAGKWPVGRRPARWDGHAARRAAESLRRLLT